MTIDTPKDNNLPTHVDNYYHILNKEETRLLFINLEEVFMRIFELEIHNKKLRRKIYGKKGSGNYSSNPDNTKYDSNMSMMSPKDMTLTNNNSTISDE
jgi:hypothetical protein